MTFFTSTGGRHHRVRVGPLDSVNTSVVEEGRAVCVWRVSFSTHLTMVPGVKMAAWVRHQGSVADGSVSLGTVVLLETSHKTICETVSAGSVLNCCKLLDIHFGSNCLSKIHPLDYHQVWEGHSFTLSKPDKICFCFKDFIPDHKGVAVL